MGGARSTCGQNRNAYRLLVRKPEGKRWVHNIKVEIVSYLVNSLVSYQSFFYLKTLRHRIRSIGLAVPHRKHITSPLRAQQVNAIYRFMAMIY
jgi:hypothetical protein